MGDMTKNFSFYEFRPKNTKRTWQPSSEYRKMLLKELVTNLQVVRSKMPKGAYMKVTSGVRTKADYDRLIKQGYHPSKTSDHNFGSAIPLSPSSAKAKKYGLVYIFSVGAADIVPVGMSVWDLFKLAVQLTKAGRCRFGQVIYEKSGEKEWVHFGVDPVAIFSPEVVKFMSRTKFMKSLDGGKSYSVVKKV